MSNTKIIVNKQGKPIEQKELNKLASEYREKHAPNQDYQLGYLHALVDDEGKDYLGKLMADGLFMGLYLAQKKGFKIKITKEEKEEDLSMFG